MTLDDARAALRAGRNADAATAANALLDAAAATLHVQPADRAALELRADAAFLAATVARREDRLDDALRQADASIEAANALGDAARRCVARAQRSQALCDLGLASEAIEQAYGALADAGEDPICEAEALQALASAHWTMERYDDATRGYARVLEIGQSRDDAVLQAVGETGLGGIEHLRGLVAADEGRDDEALASWRRAAEHAARAATFAAAAGDSQRLYTAQHNRAIALMALGDLATARAELTELAERPHAEHERARHALTLKNLADIDDTEGQHATAAARYAAALETLEGLGQLPYAAACCEALVRTQESLGDCAAALQTHKRFHALYVRVASQAAQVRAAALEAHYRTELAQATARRQQQRAEEFEKASQEDPLTGLANRRRLDTFVAAALADRRDVGFGLALLDIDHFKQVNDRFSHLVGDRVLVRIAAILRSTLRHHDLPARYGGEEFALVFADADAAQALAACERVRQAIEHEPWDALQPGLVVTASLGLVLRDEPGERSAEALFALADSRLYRAKAGGRNRVVGH